MHGQFTITITSILTRLDCSGYQTKIGQMILPTMNIESPPDELRHMDLSEYLMNWTLMSQYRVETRDEANVAVPMGAKTVFFNVPENLMKATCHDCGRSLSLYLLIVEYEEVYTFAGKTAKQTIKLCPACNMRQVWTEELEREDQPRTGLREALDAREARFLLHWTRRDISLYQQERSKDKRSA